MKRLLASVALLLAGCDQGADSFIFRTKEYDLGTVTVTVVEHPGTVSLRRAATEAGVDPESARAMAFSLITPSKARCTIHIVDPAVAYRPEWIGHELMHCVHGRWHDDGGKQ